MAAEQYREVDRGAACKRCYDLKEHRAGNWPVVRGCHRDPQRVRSPTSTGKRSFRNRQDRDDHPTAGMARFMRGNCARSTLRPTDVCSTSNAIGEASFQDMQRPVTVDGQRAAATNRIVGRVTASAMASASRASFLFNFTNGLTNCAGMIRTVWPSSPSFRAIHCAPGQASMPIRAFGAVAKNAKRVSRENFTRWIGRSPRRQACLAEINTINDCSKRLVAHAPRTGRRLRSADRPIAAQTGDVEPQTPITTG
jgi:hypothetical protein